MTGRTHQLFGFTVVYATVLVLPYLDVNTQSLVVGTMLVSLGGLAPDLDNEDNVIYTLVPAGRGIISEVFERVFGKHRSISHSLLGIAIIGYLSGWLFEKIPLENGLDTTALWYAFMIAFVTHIFADFLTKDGVPLLWPIKFRFGFPPVKFLRIKTGGWVEDYIVNGLLVLSLILLTVTYYDRVLHMLHFV
jgi:inner membrane protein